MDDINNLKDLKRTLRNASEVIAAFISVTKSEEQPLESMLEAADLALKDLVAWRNTIGGIVDIIERESVH